MVTIQPLKHKDTKEKKYINYKLLSGRKECITKKSKTIIFNNLGILVFWCLGGKITKQLQTKYILPQSRIINHYCRFLFFFDTAFG